MPQDHHQGLNITGGIWRGLRLKLPAKLPHTLRPTPEAVRETLFDWLSAWEGLPGARVLDLFAGSGALSIEALSRGAHCAVMVEADPGACAALQRTLERLNTRAQILNRTAQDYLGQSTDTFDLVFLDPPYDADVLPACLAQLRARALLAPGARLYIEQRQGSTLIAPGFRLLRTQTRSKSAFSLWEAAPEANQ